VALSKCESKKVRLTCGESGALPRLKDEDTSDREVFVI
jgi:hypothetical protein